MIDSRELSDGGDYPYETYFKSNLYNWVPKLRLVREAQARW